MAKTMKLTVRSWVHQGDELIRFDSLPPDVRRAIATELKCKYLNALFAGKVTFHPSEEKR